MKDRRDRKGVREMIRELMQHLSIKLMVTVVVTEAAIALVLDVWNVVIR